MSAIRTEFSTPPHRLDLALIIGAGGMPAAPVEKPDRPDWTGWSR